MALRLDYLARETRQNLVRNLLLSIATVIVVAISSAMLGMTMLSRDGVDNAFERWNDDVSFIVYVNPDASQDQIDSLRKSLEQSPQVDRVTYLDQDATYARFKKLFADDPTIIETVTAKDLPTSFSVKPKNPDAQVVQELVRSFEAKPGVYQVDFVADAVRAVQRFASKFQGALLTASIVLLLVSAVIIFVTIQLAVFSRRQEIDVMHLGCADRPAVGRRVPPRPEGDRRPDAPGIDPLDQRPAALDRHRRAAHRPDRRCALVVHLGELVPAFLLEQLKPGDLRPRAAAGLRWCPQRAGP